MSDFIKVPESDYQGETPTVNPLIVTLQFDKPLENEVTHNNRTWINYNYKIDHEGTEYTLSASKGLHGQIQNAGAIKDTKIKIIKKRIGTQPKDIRWVVVHVDGPVNTAKADSQPSQPVTNQSVASAKPIVRNLPDKDYEELTEEALAVWDLNQKDEALMLAISLSYAKTLWPEDTEPRVIQATAASLHIQGTRTTGGLKGLNKLRIPDPIMLIVNSIDLVDLPQSFYAAVEANSAWFDEDQDIVDLMKELDYTSMPRGLQELYEAIRLLMLYGELMFEDPDHQSAITTVKEQKSDEPAF